MSCDICDINKLFKRSGTYSICRNCGDEYGWLEVDVNALCALVDDYALLAIDADEPEDGFLLRQRRLKEKGAELQDFLWVNRYGIRNAALLAARAHEESEAHPLPQLRYDYTMRDAEWR